MEEITLFYATNNKSKLHNMRYRLKEYPIKVICPDDLGIHLSVDENGETATENALIKAKAYFEVVKMPTVAGDSGVYIEGLKKEEQPGLYVRRVNGKTLTDDEMIEYYAKLAKKAEGECYLRYFTGIALITAKGTVTKELDDPLVKLTPYPNANRRHRGNPLDVVTLTENGKYVNELTDEERIARDLAGEKDFTEFVVRNLLG